MDVAKESAKIRPVPFRIASGERGLLTINEFYWRDKPKFYEFTRSAFERMKAADTRTLLIDLRANGGGDDDVWIEGVMTYIRPPMVDI